MDGGLNCPAVAPLGFTVQARDGRLRPVNYLLVSVHFPDEPLRMCWARLTANGPRDFLPEAARFLQPKNLIPGD